MTGDPVVRVPWRQSVLWWVMLRLPVDRARHHRVHMHRDAEVVASECLVQGRLLIGLGVHRLHAIGGPLEHHEALCGMPVSMYKGGTAAEVTCRSCKRRITTAGIRVLVRGRDEVIPPLPCEQGI